MTRVVLNQLEMTFVEANRKINIGNAQNCPKFCEFYSPIKLFRAHGYFCGLHKKVYEVKGASKFLTEFPRLPECLADTREHFTTDSEDRDHGKSSFS